MLQTMTNRREYNRESTYLPVRLFAENLEIASETLSKDFSPGGMRCITQIETAPQTLYAVEITLPDSKQALSLRARQIWLQPLQASNQFELGLAFLDMTPAARSELLRYQAQLLE